MSHRLRFCVWLAASLALLGCRDPAKHQRGRADLGLGPSAVFQGELEHAEMRHPHRVAAGPEGELAVSDPRAGKVFVFSPHRTLERTISVGRPMGIIFDDVGNLSVGDTKTGAVSVHKPDGTVLHSLGAGAGEFQAPSDMAWSKESQRVHITDSKLDVVKVYDAAGTFQSSYGASGTGDGELVFPTGIVLDDASDRVYVGDHGNSRVQVFSRGGTWVKSFGSYGGGMGEYSRIQGLSLDSMQRLYVVDTFQGRMQVVDTNGVNISFLGDFGLRPGQLYLPMDAALDSYNRLTVSSYGSAKLITYGIDNFTQPPPPPEPPEYELFAADAWLVPQQFPNLGGPKWIIVYVEVPENSANNLIPSSMRLEGVGPNLNQGFELGDSDQNGIPDLRLMFSRSLVLGPMPAVGDHVLSITGELNTGDRVETQETLTVFGPGGGQ